jgi:hypothetical protein
MTLQKEMAPYFQATRDERLRELYAVEMAQKISVEPSWILKGLNATGMRVAAAPKMGGEQGPIRPEMPKDVIEMPPKVQLNKAPHAELILLNIALMAPEHFKSIWESGVVDQLTHPGVREMFLKAEAHYRQMPNEFAKLSAYLMTLTETPKLLGLHMGEPISSMNADALARYTSDCLRQVQKKYFGFKTRELAATLKNTPANMQKEKLEQIMNIQMSKHTLRRDREPEK